MSKYQSVKVFVVILVGGKGKRLRPLSTDARPKAFLSVTKDRKTIFKKAVERVKRIVPSSGIIVVANRRHARLVRKDFPGIRKENLLLEPVSRNTAPAIALAARNLQRRFSDAIMAVLPSDHVVADEGKYLRAVKKGIGLVKNGGTAIAVLGIKPSSPSTHFGYIKTGPLGKVELFTEKPGLKTAKKYLKAGRYLWNAGVFIFKSGAILKEIELFAPEVLDAIGNIARPGSRYKMAPDISIDYAVMEKARGIRCVRCECGWRDIGSFASLRAMLESESRPFIENGGKVVRIL